MAASVAAAAAAGVFDPAAVPVTQPAQIKVGDQLPHVVVRYRNERVTLSSVTETKQIVLLGVSGAFAPVCSDIHLAGVREHLNQILQHKVEFVGVLAVNDPFVLNAWAKFLDLGEHVIFIADPDARLTKQLGLLEDLTAAGLGVRCRRCALIVGPESRVKWVGLDQKAYAPHILQALNECEGYSGPGKALFDSSMSDQPSAVAAESAAQLPQQRHAGVTLSFKGDIEAQIRGPPRRASVIKYELKRSQCNLLVSSDAEDDDDDSSIDEGGDDGGSRQHDGSSSNTDGEAEVKQAAALNKQLSRLSSQQIDVDSYGLFARHFCVNHASLARCKDVRVRNVVLGSQEDDIKVKFDIPPAFKLQRVPSTSPTSLGFVPCYDLVVEPCKDSSGYVLIDSTRYYPRLMQILSPSPHHKIHSSGLAEVVPLELQIIMSTDQYRQQLQMRRRAAGLRAGSKSGVLLASKADEAKTAAPPPSAAAAHIDTKELLKEYPPHQHVQLAVMCVSIAWDPNLASPRGDALSKLLQGLTTAVRSMKTAEEQPKSDVEVEFRQCTLDLQSILAQNTLSAFYRYETDNVPLATPAEGASLGSPRVIWMVSRGAAGVALQDLAALSEAIGSPEIGKLAVAGVVEAAIHSATSPLSVAAASPMSEIKSPSEAVGSPALNPEDEGGDATATSVNYEGRMPVNDQAGVADTCIAGSPAADGSAAGQGINEHSVEVGSGGGDGSAVLEESPAVQMNPYAVAVGDGTTSAAALSPTDAASPQQQQQRCPTPLSTPKSPEHLVTQAAKADICVEQAVALAAASLNHDTCDAPPSNIRLIVSSLLG